MSQNISLEPKIEARLVEVSAAFIAAGACGLTVSPNVPFQYQPLVLAVSGALTAIGSTMLAVWHKFVNVYTEQVKQNAPVPQSPSQ